MTTAISDIEYRSVIRFFVLKGTSAKYIFDELTAVYGESAPSYTTVKYWTREFKGGRTSVLDEERSGRPREFCIDDKLTSIILRDRRITVRQLSCRLNVSVGTIHERLEALGIRKLCSRFVPRFLSAEMMERRKMCCQKNIEIFEEYGEQFLSNIITEDETSLTLYLPESKRESSEWKLPGEKPTNKMRSSSSHRRVMMLSVFWDRYGIIMTDFASKGKTITGQYYSELVLCARKKRRKQRNTPLWILHDNAPVHTAAISKAAVSDAGLTIVDHPPYSPDLAPSDFWLFNHLKKHLRGKVFNDDSELRESVEQFLSSLTADFFNDAFVTLLKRWKKCLEQMGGYIEK